MKRAAFLDRDGVINHDRGYVHRSDDFEFIEGVEEGLSTLSGLGYRLIVVTNQSGIGRGFYGEAEYRALTDHMNAQLSRKGVTLDAVYHCPHAPSVREACDCRKPRPGMLLDAAIAHGITLARSILIGDKPSDIAAARAAAVGCAFLVGGASRDPGDADGWFPTLRACADQLARLAAREGA